MTRTHLLRKVGNYSVIKKLVTSMDQYQSGLAYIDVKDGCNPFDLFKVWLEEAKEYGKFKTVSFNLATASACGDVSNRTMVMRDFINQSFVFVTNGNGRKSQQINQNPKVSVCFLWCYPKDEMFINKQIRVEGNAVQLSYEECEVYYNKEPLFCQIRSHICQQDEKVDWTELKRKHDQLLEQVKMSKKPLKMPEYQVGYKIIPNMLEFYYAWNNNIGDRLLFTKKGEDQWAIDRIAA